MILFMVSPPAGKSPERYPIPLHCTECTKADIEKLKVRFISWNEADYQLDDEIIVHIINIDMLKLAVYNAARQDEAVCGVMIEQFRVQYGIDIFDLWDKPADPAYHIIGDVFAQWPHPMIGNMVVSSGIRPQTFIDQYTKNWASFPEDYMTEETKASIEQLIKESLPYDPESPEASPAGLRRLAKSGRDQVRCCKDMTELARAVIGEITTYASKKLEKIYALELCNSERFLAAQKEFMKRVVLIQTETGIKENPTLKVLFDGCKTNPIMATEYIYFYFPSLAGLQKKDQWIAFICLINEYLGGDCKIPCDRPAEKETGKLIDLCVEEYRKFPPIIRGAMIINAIRKFNKPLARNRYSFKIADEAKGQWEIVDAPNSFFIPTLPKWRPVDPDERVPRILLWNWTRNERHPVTEGYRKCLIPLWAGPSGHSAGLLDFYWDYFGTDYFSFEGKLMSASLIILPTMFAFWRLYYDKRICAVHTLAETFEGALSHALSVEDQQKVLTYISNQVNVEAIMVHMPRDLTYEEVFDTLRLLPFTNAKILNNTGIMHPVRIMAQVRAKHYDTLAGEGGIEKINALDGIIDDLRGRLTEQHYEMPRWSQPIRGLLRDGSIAESAGGEAFSGLEISCFHRLNVKVFGQKALLRLMARQYLMGRGSVAPAMSDSGLRSLYDKICACAVSEKGYQFTDDFPELPGCYIDGHSSPFLDGVSFSDIRECSLAEGAFTYRAEIGTDATFWKQVKEIVPLVDSEEIFCTVRETSDGLCFTGEIAAESVYRVADKLSLTVHRVSIESGLDDVSCFPCICITAQIRAQNEERFDLMIVVSPDGDRLYISGEYEEGRVLTIAGLLSLFGLDGVIQGYELLPDEESVFGSLGLRSVSVTVDTASEGITQIGFTVTAGKPWNIFDDKIALQPYFEMNIEYPFDSGRRKVDYSVLGKWHIGSTVFDLMYRSDKTIYAGLAEDSTLDFADVAGLFAKDVSFPPVELTGMEFSADVASGDYALYLSADHVLEFEVGIGKLGIEGLSLSLRFTDGKFGALKLGGSFALGGVTLAVSGSYGADTGLMFEAMAYSEEDYSLGDFIAQAARDLGQDFARESLPDTLLSVNIRMLTASYDSGKKAFHGYVDLENVLVVSENFAIREMALKISSEQGASAAFQVIARIHICGTEVELTVSKDQEGFILSGEAVFTDLTFGGIAGELGIDMEHLPAFLSEFAVTDLGVKYNFTTKAFSMHLTTSAGKISAEITASAGETATEIAEGGQSEWRICYETDPKVSVDMLRMPLVGELVQKTAPGTTGLSVKDFVLEASSTKGVVFRCMAFGSACTLELSKPAADHAVVQSDEAAHCSLTDQIGQSGNSIVPETVKWINLNKTFAVLTISKAGIGLDGSRVVLLLDASLAVSPFTFSLVEAGVGINISRLSDVAFYLSGFGVAFDNGVLAIGGSFYRKRSEEKEVYAGSLLVKCKTVTVTAVGEYSSGSLFAYMALSASIGGPPAFFVTGLSLGFGYNSKLILPPVEQVAEYPLIKAAQKGFDERTLEELNNYITEENGQNFLTAGVKFTSFQIVDGFLLLSVSFGKKFQIGVLGIADLSMPPRAPSNPVARAQLAIRAEYDPSAGVFRAEARLTSESYILSRDCKLTGGFAAFFWFEGSEHSGDFVITLGGYHPAYQKPAHYPDVPRLGLNWNVNSNLNISGEIYFALTPGAVMAGGKLSAVYTQGKLRAWFIAYADFIVSWKPFSYQARIGVSLGASYRVDLWFIHKTFSIELAADLELWGPEVQGRLHVSWFIISFTITFSKGSDHSGETLDWGAFKESFLQDKGQNRSLGASKVATSGDTDILAVTVTGACGQAPDGTDIIDPGGFGITLLSKIPEQGNVRPVNNAELRSAIALTVEDEHKRTINDRFRQESVVRNVPAALWKSAPAPQNRLREESMVKDARCGVSYNLKSEVRNQELFPKTRFISLDELYRNNTLAYGDCFRFLPDQYLSLSDEDSIRRFSQSADSEETGKRRQKYLADNGITEQVSITRFAEEAENWLSEELLIDT